MCLASSSMKLVPPDMISTVLLECPHNRVSGFPERVIQGAKAKAAILVNDFAWECTHHQSAISCWSRGSALFVVCRDDTKVWIPRNADLWGSPWRLAVTPGMTEVSESQIRALPTGC